MGTAGAAEEGPDGVMDGIESRNQSTVHDTQRPKCKRFTGTKPFYATRKMRRVGVEPTRFPNTEHLGTSPGPKRVTLTTRSSSHHRSAAYDVV